VIDAWTASTKRWGDVMIRTHPWTSFFFLLYTTDSSSHMTHFPLLTVLRDSSPYGIPIVPLLIMTHFL
jgi:hypothetical protein